MTQSTYDKRGVSASKEDVHNAIKDIDKGLFPNAFCKILPDFAGRDSDFVNIMHADTAGTKSALAYLYWKETGDLSVWEGIVQDAVVMNLDDMAAAGMTNDFILSSTIGRNKSHIDGSVVASLIKAQSKLAENFKSIGVDIHFAGGETADVGDIVRTVDVGFTAFGRMNKSDVVNIDIKEGDVVVGFASYGQATYENSYNSGIGSNGLTFARHEVLIKAYADKYPESFDPQLSEEVVYCGSSFLTDPFPGLDFNVGQMLLSPTRTYLPVIKKILGLHRKDIHGIIHCTGGGLSKVLHFTSDYTIEKNNPIKVAPIFNHIQQQTGANWSEMYKVFNMGQRLEIYVPQEIADEIVAIGKSFNIDTQIIGRVKQGKKQVIVTTPFGEFCYQ